MSAAAPSSSRPSSSQLKSESSTLPPGWRVYWSHTHHRRFYYRPPQPATNMQPATPAMKIWTTPLIPGQRPPPPSASALPPAFKLVPPTFEAWRPPSAETESAANEALAQIKHEFEGAAAQAEAEAKVKRENGAVDAEERERELDRSANTDMFSKKRRVGLGFDAEENGRSGGGGGDDYGSSTRRKTSHHNGGMAFVTSGGVAADTPASHITSAMLAALAAFPTLQPIPHRMISASAPRCTVNDTPVYATSYDALCALRLGPACPPSKWSSSSRYAEILEVSQIIAANSIYGVKDVEIMEEYLQTQSELPTPDTKALIQQEEELPAVVLARRTAFNDLDLELTRLIRAAGGREQPAMAFLRFGFNQRSLQVHSAASVIEGEDTNMDGGSSASANDPSSFDPLIPISATTDVCLVAELVKEKMSHEAAVGICTALAAKCKVKAQELVALRKRLHASPQAKNEVKKFDLLFPSESHLHSFTKPDLHSHHNNSSSSSSSSSAPTAPLPRDRDIHTFNQDEREQYKIIYDLGGRDEYAIPLNQPRLDQLRADYARKTGVVVKEEELKNDQVFLRRLWTMCARYDTISGAGYQAALPVEAFESLRRNFGVEYECYASPLNHCLDEFGSAFIETDRFFGSQGSFLDQRMLQGGFEANPPFLEEVMAPMALHVLALMERAESQHLPLCFVCVWPGWDDTPAYDLLMTSRFMRKLIVFEKGDHYYKEGLQHRCTKAAHRLSRARSFAFFVQTEAAATKWPCTEEKLNDFKQEFMKYRL